MKLNIVLVEDHQALRKVTAGVLREAGFAVLDLAHAEDVDALLVEHRVDVFILDINLLGESGLSLARRLRNAYPLVGIIMFTARSANAEIVEGYGAGADIYLTKPVDSSVLISAVESLGRRMYSSSVQGRLEMNTTSLELRGDLGSTRLQSAEVEVLSAFARSPKLQLETGQVAELFGMDDIEFSKSALEVRIVRLRKKLKSVCSFTDLQAVRLIGYKLTGVIKII